MTLQRVGPLLSGAWSRLDDELGRESRGEFLLDTGAFGAMIDLEVAQSLELSIIGTREVHGIHGYGRLQEFRGRITLPASDPADARIIFTSVIDCVGVPSLREKNREHGVEIVGILGRIFLSRAALQIDGESGRVDVKMRD